MKLFRNIIRWIRAIQAKSEPLIRVFIHKKQLLDNLNVFKTSGFDTLVAPVLKSNAYGHGLIQIAKTLDDQNLAFFVVDSLFEVRILKKQGIKTPLLVIGYTPLNNLVDNAIFTITSLEELRIISQKLKRKIRFHIKIDTGMHRQGIDMQEFEQAVSLLKSNSNILVEGICSHFADSDNLESNLTSIQINRWNKSVAWWRNQIPIKYFHIAATGGIRYLEQIDCNAIRIGRGLYGIGPLAKEYNLLPILEMRSKISTIRRIEAGETVGYGATFQASHDMTIATVPVGYAEGLDRRLSNIGCFLVKGTECPIVGRVSMNITSIDVSNVKDVSINDEVVIISNNPDKKNSIQNMAEMCNTIPHEILVHIPAYLRRDIIE